MKNPLPTRPIKAALIALAGFFALILSAPGVAQTSPGLIDMKAVTNIEVSIADDHLEQFGFPLPLQEMRGRIADNLMQWRFPVRVAGKNIYSHTLAIQIGEIKTGTTPVGFSFSSGDSDPRAAGFQKAEVMPVSCRLTANGKPRQDVELEMSFSANRLIRDLKNHGHQAKIIDQLIDNMSTVCFDLLDGLNWVKPEQQSMPLSIKPTWMPQVKIESIPVPVPAGKVKSAVHSEIDNTEERKQIIIHNQGSPLILKFGHERR
ncbi:MAG: hypothetical protein EPN89_01840 [Methylovulum sp.]|nr:MAG: hypothetical protein EPN89_01840 [Methylovulum sp.]